MKPRVWRQYPSGAWLMRAPVWYFGEEHDTWQAAMDAALAWSREHYAVSFDLWEGCVYVLHAGQIVGAGMDKQQAIRNAARTLRYAATNTNDRSTP